jgi:hypothetical protein
MTTRLFAAEVKILPDGIVAGYWLLWCRTVFKKIEPLLISGIYTLQWRYHPFRVDRDRLTGLIFSYVSRKKYRTAKIMTLYSRQLFMGNPMAPIPLSVDDLEGVISRSRK